MRVDIGSENGMYFGTLVIIADSHNSCAQGLESARQLHFDGLSNYPLRDKKARIYIHRISKRGLGATIGGADLPCTLKVF